MVDINTVNSRIIERINNTFENGIINSFSQLFDTQIITVTDVHVYRETKDVSNGENISLPYSLKETASSNDVIAIATGFYMVEASKVREVENDYFTQWWPRYGDIIPTALDLTIFTKDYDLLKERISLTRLGDSYRLTDHFCEPEIYQDARGLVTNDHEYFILDELINQLA